MSPLGSPSFAGAVLVGGRSTRMGCHKALVEVDGVPMASRVARALREAGAESVSLVGGPTAWGDTLGVAWMADRYPDQGPLGGLLTALSDPGGERPVVVVACDLPWLDVDTLTALVLSLGHHDVALAYTDRREPLCGIWRPTPCREALQPSFDQGERALHRALAGLDVVDVPVAARALTNVNAPVDLPIDSSVDLPIDAALRRPGGGPATGRQ